nr:cell division protein FtsQ/DivIB [Oleiagrimonas sp. C23AA]
MAWSIAVLLVVLPVVGLMQGWFASKRWPIRELTVQAPLRHVSAATLRGVVMPLLGKGFFATDLDDVQKAVAALPWVASVEARKRWPDTLVLTVSERQPFAHWNDDELISRKGRLFSAPGAAALGGLPSLRGPDDRMLEVVDFYLDAAREVASVTRRQVSGVTLSGRDAWTLHMHDGADIVIGGTDPQARLKRFLDVYPTLMRGRQQSFVYADLRYSNGFAVRWPQPAAATDQPATAGGHPST